MLGRIMCGVGIPAVVVTSGRRAVGVSPITCLVAQTAVVAKLVVPENDLVHVLLPPKRFLCSLGPIHISSAYMSLRV